MKKIIMLAAAAALCLGASAKTLKVYSVSGNVTKKAGSSWTAVTKPGTLSDSETVKINPSSTLRVLDPSTRQIYTFSNQGTFTLSSLIAQAAKENSSLSGKIAAESKRQQTASASKSHKQVGAAKRATLDEEEQEALYTSLVKGFEAGTNVGNLTLGKVAADDGLFYLTLSNTGDEELYANVFTKDEDGHWVSLYTFDNENPALLILPGATVTMDHMLLADEGDEPYVAVGYTSVFDGAELSDMFSEEFEPGETEAENVNFHFLK